MSGIYRMRYVALVLEVESTAEMVDGLAQRYVDALNILLPDARVAVAETADAAVASLALEELR